MNKAILILLNYWFVLFASLFVYKVKIICCFLLSPQEINFNKLIRGNLKTGYKNGRRIKGTG